MFSIVAAGQPMGLTTTSWCDVKHYSPCLCSMFNSMFSIVLVTKIPWGCVLSWGNFPVWKSSKRLGFYNHWNIRQSRKCQRGIDGFSQYACLVDIKRSSSHTWYCHRCNPGQKTLCLARRHWKQGFFPLGSSILEQPPSSFHEKPQTHCLGGMLARSSHFLILIGDDGLSDLRFQVEKAFCFGTGTVPVRQIRIFGFLSVALVCI